MDSRQSSTKGLGGWFAGRHALAAAAAAILRALCEDGRTAVRELPYAWPLTRMHLVAIVDRLIDEGWVARAGNGGEGRDHVQLTAAGATRLDAGCDGQRSHPAGA
jgi:DNA-binding MarR family transcriptional regulator